MHIISRLVPQVPVQTFHSHTLMDLDAVQAMKGPGFKPPTAMKGIAELVEHYKASTKGALAPKAVPKMPKLAVKAPPLRRFLLRSVWQRHSRTT